MEIKKGNRSGMIRKGDFVIPNQGSTTTNLLATGFTSGFRINALMVAILNASVSSVFKTSLMIFNEAKLDKLDLTHLYFRRF